jgi:VCBS repeat-containing protein
MSIDANTGVFSWTPTEAQGGLTPSVTVTVTDSGAGALTDSETFTITVNDINVAPVIISPNTANIAENTTAVLTVTATDADLPAQTLSFSITGGVDSGRFSINGATGALTFSAAPDYESPSDSDTNNVYVLQVTASDGAGLTVSQTINVTVTGVNEAPLGIDDTATTFELTPITFNVVSNDTDPEGDALVVSTVTQGANGTVTFAGGSVTYTPNADFSGPDNFAYTVSDGNGGTTTATVHVTVAPIAAVKPTVASLATEGQTLAAATSGATDSSGQVAIDSEPVRNGTATPFAADTMSILGGSNATYSHGSTASTSSGFKLGASGSDNGGNSFDGTEANPLEEAFNGTGNGSSTGNANQQGSIETLREELEDLIDRIGNTFQTGPRLHGSDAEAMMSSEVVQRELDGLKQQLDKSTLLDQLKEKLVIGTASGIGGTFFVGYVMWALRGTSLLASALASLPLWRCFDPLTVLPAPTRRRRKRDAEQKGLAEDENRNVEELFSSAPSPRAWGDVKGTGR